MSISLYYNKPGLHTMKFIKFCFSGKVFVSSSLHLKKIFIYSRLRERESRSKGEWQREGKREKLKQNSCWMWSLIELDIRTLRSQPDTKSRVGYAIDWAIQVLLFYLTFLRIILPCTIFLVARYLFVCLFFFQQCMFICFSFSTLNNIIPFASSLNDFWWETHQ